VITGAQEPEVHQRVMELGAAAIVTKPFEPMQLAGVLQQVLAGDEPEPPRGTSPGGGLRPLGT
jgi:CheY-like chemotaxis protein